MRGGLLALLVLAGCRQATEPTPASEILQRTRELSAAMCACKDKACGEPLRAQWDELTRGASAAGKISGATFTAEQVEGLAVEDQRFMTCMAALDAAI